MNTVLLFITFSVLLTMGLISQNLREKAFSRTRSEWIIDVLGLFIQGTIIPAFPFILVPILKDALPSYAGAIEISAFWQFFLGFVLVDYLYYWNHRLFHKKNFWVIHRLHHSSRHLDILATSRNSLITSFLFVYIWAEILGMYFIKDSTPFMLSLGVTFALDLWRHSGLKTFEFLFVPLSKVFIIPELHTYHHALKGRNKNFGANLCWWDKIHGTYSETVLENENLERLSGKSIWKELLIPWKANK